MQRAERRLRSRKIPIRWCSVPMTLCMECPKFLWCLFVKQHVLSTSDHPDSSVKWLVYISIGPQPLKCAVIYCYWHSHDTLPRSNTCVSDIWTLNSHSPYRTNHHHCKCKDSSLVLIAFWLQESAPMS